MLIKTWRWNIQKKHQNISQKSASIAGSGSGEQSEKPKRIKDIHIKERLLNLWEILWLNNCSDFDIICYEFAYYEDMKKALTKGKEINLKIDKNSLRKIR